jgi:hypothetical protein
MITCVVMMVLNNNLVTAFGLMAVFAVVRFRNVLRDTLDTSYVLTVLALGMACGTQRFSLAVVATLTLILAMFYLYYTGFGTRHRYDVIVNLHWARPGSELGALNRLLVRHSRNPSAPASVQAALIPGWIFLIGCFCATQAVSTTCSKNFASWMAFHV